ncbi:MAG: hypothetical protein KDK65_06280 [Chlamydiia bacterium]|nr:hypothetical protein [Chlamydiia bacterium]
MSLVDLYSLAETASAQPRQPVEPEEMSRQSLVALLSPMPVFPSPTSQPTHLEHAFSIKPAPHAGAVNREALTTLIASKPHYLEAQTFLPLSVAEPQSVPKGMKDTQKISVGKGVQIHLKGARRGFVYTLHSMNTLSHSSGRVRTIGDIKIRLGGSKECYVYTLNGKFRPLTGPNYTKVSLQAMGQGFVNRHG